MAKKKRNKKQIPVAFPPELSPRLIYAWKAVKAKYPNCLVLLAQENVYFAIDTDAVTLSEIAELPLISGTVLLTYFSAASLEDVIHLCVKSGYRLAITELPDEPENHLFT